MEPLNNLLIVAGVDPSCGAGLGADIRVASFLGVYPSFAVSTITIQNTISVKDNHPIPLSQFKDQLEYLVSDLRPQAVKIGLLPEPTLVKELAKTLRKLLHNSPRLPIILDPVTVSSSGVPLTTSPTRQALTENLLPLCSLITPNLNEAAFLAGVPPPISNIDLIGEKLLSFGCSAVFITGGETSHAKQQQECRDLLYQKNVPSPKTYSAPRVPTNNTHGTGCLLSTAIASFLAQGHSLELSLKKAKKFMNQSLSLSRSIHLGQGKGPAFIKPNNTKGNNYEL